MVSEISLDQGLELSSEIRRSPVDMENIPFLIGFHTCQVVSRISSINSMIHQNI